MPATQALAYATMNPLVGLSSAALRLYGALEVFRDAYQCPELDGWFHTPQLNRRLERVGLTRSEVEKALAELSSAGLLEIRKNLNISWYRLK